MADTRCGSRVFSSRIVSRDLDEVTCPACIELVLEDGLLRLGK